MILKLCGGEVTCVSSKSHSFNRSWDARTHTKKKSVTHSKIITWHYPKVMLRTTAGKIYTSTETR